MPTTKTFVTPWTQQRNELLSKIQTRYAIIFTILFRNPTESEAACHGEFDFPYHWGVNVLTYDGTSQSYTQSAYSYENYYDFNEYAAHIYNQIPDAPFNFVKSIIKQNLAQCTFIFNSNKTKRFLIYALKHISDTALVDEGLAAKLQSGVLIEPLINYFNQDDQQAMHLELMEYNYQNFHNLNTKDYNKITKIIKTYRHEDLSLFINDMYRHLSSGANYWIKTFDTIDRCSPIFYWDYIIYEYIFAPDYQ